MVETIGSVALIQLGQNGFTRIADTNVHNGSFVAIKAINGNVVFGAGNTVSSGDAPAVNDVLMDGDTLLAPFINIQLLSGAAYAYRG